MVHLPEQQLLPLLRPFALGDVASDFGCANNSSIAVPNGRSGQGNIDEAAVLAPQNRLTLIDRFNVTNAAKDYRLLIVPMGREDDCHWPADRLIRRIAEKPLRPLIPRQNHAIEICGENGLFRGLDDRRVELRSAIVRQKVVGSASRWRHGTSPNKLWHWRVIFADCLVANKPGFRVARVSRAG